MQNDKKNIGKKDIKYKIDSGNGKKKQSNHIKTQKLKRKNVIQF